MSRLDHIHARFPGGRRHTQTEAPTVIEDATFIADTGYGLTEAAQRLDFYTVISFERYLLRAGAHTLVQRLKHQDWAPLRDIEGGYDHHNQWSA